MIAMIQSYFKRLTLNLKTPTEIWLKGFREIELMCFVHALLLRDHHLQMAYHLKLQLLTRSSTKA